MSPPLPSSNSVQERCANLGDVLPAKLEQLSSRVISPRSPLTHAWGSPPVVMRCGVPTPAAYDPSSSQTAEVNGVSWFEEIVGTAVRWTAIRPGANVELTVPQKYRDGPGSGAYLVDLADPIKKALP